MVSLKASAGPVRNTLALAIAISTSGACAMSNRDAAGDSQASNEGGRVTVTGRLTSEGVECQALRGDDGQLYTLLGDLGRLSVDTRVRVIGERVELSICQQGITIRVRSITPADTDRIN